MSSVHVLGILVILTAATVGGLFLQWHSRNWALGALCGAVAGFGATALRDYSCSRR